MSEEPAPEVDLDPTSEQSAGTSGHTIDLTEKGESASETDLPTKPYSPARDRELARRRIAYALLVLLFLTFLGVGLGFALTSEAGSITLSDLTAAFLTPVIGLVSFVLGFYFGDEKT